ncbi:MAG TPA: DUF3817 domain-containing protein [Planctomicrobium sp.]|nr:DUF3817 domain-containing protein [Planctomicrobium sp.]
MNPKNTLISLRVVGFLEGLSFLVLLLIAMPLKYAAGLPHMVEIVGALHGGLFILYILAVAWGAWTFRWSFYRIAEALIASIVPTGTFFLERRWHREQLALQTNKTVP